jgi:hypothetical protein
MSRKKAERESMQHEVQKIQEHDRLRHRAALLRARIASVLEADAAVRLPQACMRLWLRALLPHACMQPRLRALLPHACMWPWRRALLLHACMHACMRPEAAAELCALSNGACIVCAVQAARREKEVAHAEMKAKLDKLKARVDSRMKPRQAKDKKKVQLREKVHLLPKLRSAAGCSAARHACSWRALLGRRLATRVGASVAGVA